MNVNLPQVWLEITTPKSQCVLAWTCDFGVFAESQNISNFQARNEFLGQNSHK